MGGARFLGGAALGLSLAASAGVSDTLAAGAGLSAYQGAWVLEGRGLCGRLCIRRQSGLVQEARRHFRTGLHHLRQAPENPHGDVQHPVGSTDRGPSASHSRLCERRGEPGGAGFHGTSAERGSQTLLQRAGPDGDRLPALFAMRRRTMWPARRGERRRRIGADAPSRQAP